MMDKLVTVTAKDCEWQYFRCGGNGGQKVNKTNSGARCIHHPSGAIGESREERSQRQNRQNAFGRMVKTKEFEQWLRIENSKALGNWGDVQKQVDDLMNPCNLIIEGIKDGKWDNIANCVPLTEEDINKFKEKIYGMDGNK